MTLLLAAEILEQLQRSSEAIEYVRRFLGQDENAADVRLRLAGLLEQQGNHGEAVQQYRRILNSDGNNVSVLTRVAWLLATSPDDTIRDGNAALQFAQQAIQAHGQPLPVLLDVLAAAQAEVGRYEDAIRTIRNAMKLAAESGDSRSMNGLRERAELYRQRKHYRSSR